MKILIVDDELFARNVLKRLLINNETEIIEAETAYEGYLKYEAENPDIIICDVMMKNIGGEWLVERLLKNFPDANIIVCSGNPQVELLKFKLMGAKAVLRKPIKYNELWNAVDKIIER